MLFLKHHHLRCSSSLHLSNQASVRVRGFQCFRVLVLPKPDDGQCYSDYKKKPDHIWCQNSVLPTVCVFICRYLCTEVIYRHQSLKVWKKNNEARHLFESKCTNTLCNQASLKHFMEYGTDNKELTGNDARDVRRRREATKSSDDDVTPYDQTLSNQRCLNQLLNKT